MTNEERTKAFELRLRGKPWDEIARELNYANGTSVEHDIKRCVFGRRKKIPCQYPAIQNIIVSEYYGSFPSFAEACGVKYSAMYNALSRRDRKLPKRVAVKICETTGLTYEEAFGNGQASL